MDSRFQKMIEQLPQSGFSDRQHQAENHNTIKTQRKLSEYYQIDSEVLPSFLENASQVFSEIAKNHDQVIERWVFYLYVLDIELDIYDPDDILLSYLEIPEPEKDFYRLIIEKLLVSSNSEAEMKELVSEINKVINNINQEDP